MIFFSSGWWLLEKEVFRYTRGVEQNGDDNEDDYVHEVGEKEEAEEEKEEEEDEDDDDLWVIRFMIDSDH